MNSDDVIFVPIEDIGCPYNDDGYSIDNSDEEFEVFN